jgi:hypothetical protein
VRTCLGVVFRWCAVVSLLTLTACGGTQLARGGLSKDAQAFPSQNCAFRSELTHAESDRIVDLIHKSDQTLESRRNIQRELDPLCVGQYYNLINTCLMSVGDVRECLRFFRLPPEYKAPKYGARHGAD